jgi:hypothetical protein
MRRFLKIYRAYRIERNAGDETKQLEICSGLSRHIDRAAGCRMLAIATDRSELLASMRNAPNNGRLGQSETWQILGKMDFYDNYPYRERTWIIA